MNRNDGLFILSPFEMKYGNYHEHALTPGAPPPPLYVQTFFLCEFCLMKHKPNKNHHRKAGAYPGEFRTNGIENAPRLRSHTVRPVHWLKIERHHLERSSKFTSARIGCSAFTDMGKVFSSVAAGCSGPASADALSSSSHFPRQNNVLFHNHRRS